MNPNVTISGHIGIFELLTVVHLPIALDNKVTYQADENGYISIQLFPGNYYLSMTSIKTTVFIDRDMSIEDIINVES